MARKRKKTDKPVPGLHLNLTQGSVTLIVPASEEPTTLTLSKIPKVTNKLAVQASKPVEVRK